MGFRKWLRKKELQGYANNLILAMLSGMKNVKAKDPNLNSINCIKTVLSQRRNWRQIDNQTFLFKDDQDLDVKIKDDESISNVLCDIANIEILNMYSAQFGKIMKWDGVKASGDLMLKGLGESEAVQKIIRERVSE